MTRILRSHPFRWRHILAERHRFGELRVRPLPGNEVISPSTKQFATTIVRTDDRAHITFPFDPDEAWGAKERHHVAGSIGTLRRSFVEKGLDPSRLTFFAGGRTMRLTKSPSYSSRRNAASDFRVGVSLI